MEKDAQELADALHSDPEFQAARGEFVDSAVRMVTRAAELGTPYVTLLCMLHTEMARLGAEMLGIGPTVTIGVSQEQEVSSNDGDTDSPGGGGPEEVRGA